MQRLQNHFYKPPNPASFSNADKLSKSAKVSKKIVQKWLENQDSYTLHKQIRKKFQRNKYLVTNIGDLFQADLIDMRSLKEHNDDINYLLSVIDVFSKYVWVKPLRSKTATEVAAAFREIFNDQTPISIQTDK